MISSGNHKIVATLRADGNVYPTKSGLNTLSNLMAYKIKTENDVAPKNFGAVGVVPTTVVDLGKLLLQYARDSDVKGVKNMLSRGAPFTSDWLGMSALHFAAMNNEYDMCSILLKAGINKDAKTKVDRSPLHYACTHGHEKIVELLLSSYCAVNPRDMLNMTPLHWAVEKRHKNVVRMLLKYYADVTIVSKFGKTPMAIAVQTEQVDLLPDLEAAKQAQANRKFNEESAKETTDAVNSIVDFGVDLHDTTQLDSQDDLTNSSDFAESKLSQFDNVKAPGVLSNNAINLLKSHGITMMEDNDDDTSKHMLNNVLQNGRKLVLSEGGKLLLNETKRIQQNSNNNNSNLNHNNNNTNNNNNSNSNSNNRMRTQLMPVRIKNEPFEEKPYSKINDSKMRINAISRVKEYAYSTPKNKNIRVISLNDFKKLYSNPNVKTVSKLPASLANSRLVRQLSEGNGKIMNMQQNVQQIKLQQQQRQQAATKLQQNNNNNNSISSSRNNSTTFNENDLIEEDDDTTTTTTTTIPTTTNVVRLSRTDSEAETSDVDMKPTVMRLNRTISTAIQTQPATRIIQTRRVEHKLAGSTTIRQLQTSGNSAVGGGGAIKTYSALKTEVQSGDATGSGGGSGSGVTSAAAAASAVVNNNNNNKSNVVPLLSMPEICRQLLDLRRQNQELRRKLETTEKTNEDLRQRLDRLEEMFLVERTDIDDDDSELVQAS